MDLHCRQLLDATLSVWRFQVTRIKTLETLEKINDLEKQKSKVFSSFRSWVGGIVVAVFILVMILVETCAVRTLLELVGVEEPERLRRRLVESWQRASTSGTVEFDVPSSNVLTAIFSFGC